MYVFRQCQTVRPSMSQGSKRQYEAKVVLLGTTLVGKTTIVTRATTGKFDGAIKQTVGACYTAQTVALPGGTIKLQIWDTAGQERFKTLAPMYYRGASVLIIVFSVTDHVSFNEVEFWARGGSGTASVPPGLILVGNKVDLFEERCVTFDQGQALAARLGAEYIEVSALTGDQIDALFDLAARVALTKVQEMHQPTETLVVEGTERNSERKCGC